MPLLLLGSLHLPSVLDPPFTLYQPNPQIRAATRGGVYIIALHSTLASEDQVRGGGGKRGGGGGEEGVEGGKWS